MVNPLTIEISCRIYCINNEYKGGGAVGKQRCKAVEGTSYGDGEDVRHESGYLSKSPSRRCRHRDADFDGYNEQLAEALSTGRHRRAAPETGQ